MSERDRDEGSLVDFLKIIIAHRSLVQRLTAVVAIAAIVGGAVYYFLLQPTRQSASLQFRPAFEGVDDGKYPNDLPFAPSDIIDRSVIGAVYDQNAISQYCGREEFRSGFFVAESSTELRLIDMEYQSRLGDARLTAVDRERLQNEYRSRREALPVRYELRYVWPDQCRTLPATLMGKLQNEVLQTWAEESDKKRGVLRLRVPVFTPAILNVHPLDNSRLIYADLLRSALARTIANIQQIEQMPGVDVSRRGENQLTLPEIRAQLENLLEAYVEPLAVQAGRGLGPDALPWVQQQLEAVESQLNTTVSSTQAYLDALREYSGTGRASPVTPGTERRAPGEGPALTTQIDSTFIERIVELSETNTSFRQELTRKMIEQSVQGIQYDTEARYYRRLLTALQKPAGSSMSTEEVDRRLAAIREEGSRLIKAYNEAYEELSRIALRPVGAMYHVESPPQFDAIRAFGLRQYALLVLGAILAAVVLGTVAALVDYWFRRASAEANVVRER